MKSIEVKGANIISFDSRVELRARKVNIMSFNNDSKVKRVDCYNLSLSFRVLKQKKNLILD